MSNENVTLIKELGIFLTIASEKQALSYTSDVPVGHPNIFWRSLWHIMMDQGNNNCFALHDVS